MIESKPVKAEVKEAKSEVKATPKPEAGKPHRYPLWLYHAEQALEGKLCQNAEHHKGEGWVDTPAKFPKALKA